jgi:spermidine/putrescine transport system permease protein
VVEKRSIFSRTIPQLFFGIVYLFMYLPIVALTIYSFNESGVSLGWTGFSLKWYSKMLESNDMLAALWTSLVIATASTFFSILFGLLVVVGSKWWPGNEYRKIGKKLLFGVFYPSAVLPEIVPAVALLSFFVFISAPLGYFSTIAGHAVIGLGVTVPLIRSRFLELDPFLTEASLDLGASYIQTFFRVLLPLMSPTLLAASFIVFTISLDDFFIAFFCAGPALDTVSLYVYAQVRTVIDPSINALSACLFILSIFLAFILVRSKVMDKVVSNG